MRELAGLHALARSLVHGDADADDLIQDTAIVALSHPPDEKRPVRPWLATVLRNRWRMDRRGRARRSLREQAVGLALADEAHDASTPDAIDRARTLERLASALVALDEPFREVVIRRYLDGQSAADISRALGVPAGTVRWRLKTALARLRAALDESTPRWQRALMPIPMLQGAVLVKAKTTIVSLVVLILLIAGGIVALVAQRGSSSQPQPMQVAKTTANRPALAVGAVTAGDAPPLRPDRLPGQGRVAVEPVARRAA